MLAWNTRAHAQDLVPPRLVTDSPATYPTEFRGSGRSTTVALELTIDSTGAVRRAEVLRADEPAFDAAAVEAGSALRFEPARRAGKPIASVVSFAYRFVDPEPPAGVVDPPASTPSPAPPSEADAPSAETAAEAEPAELEVDVLGDRPPREPTVRVLEREEIRTVPGTGGDVIRAVETMPGVARPPAMGPEIVVRGSSPNDTQVFVDGTWIPGVYHFGGVRTVLPAEVLERLDFYPGNFGPQYGRGMGGIIDVGIRSPRKDRLGASAQVDLLDGRALVEGPLGERTRVLAGARRSWVDAWIGPVLEAGGTRTRTAPVYYDWQAIVEHDVSSRTTARLLWFGSDDRMAIVNEAGSAQDPLFTGDLAMRSSFQRLQARIDTRLEGGGRVTSQASWGTLGERFSFGDQFADAFYHLVDARSDARIPIARGVALGGGLDVFYATYDVSLRLGPYRGTDEVAGPYFARPPRKVDGAGGALRPAGYTYVELTPTRGLSVVPSLRADYSQDTGRVTFDPRVSARWDLTHGAPRTTVKSAVGIYHQPPQPVESLPPFGTPGIESSAALHASTGFEQELWRGVELSVEGYAKHLTGLVVASPSEDDTAIGARFANTGTGSVLGAEALLRARVGRVNGWLAYSLSRSVRRSTDHEAYQLAAWDQTHVASAVTTVDVGRGWTAGGRLRFVSGTPFTPYVGGVVDLDAGAYAPVPGAPLSDRLPPFYQLDLRVEKVWSLSERARLAAYLDVQNATNRKNPEGLVHRYDYAQRDVAAGLPILPILGLRGEL